MLYHVLSGRSSVVIRMLSISFRHTRSWLHGMFCLALSAECSGARSRLAVAAPTAAERARTAVTCVAAMFELLCEH